MPPEPAQHPVPAPQRRALLLVNSRARSGGAAIDDALAVLREGGIAVGECAFSERHPIADVIAAEAPNVDCVIVGGGDGTLNAAAPALVRAGLPLGILPLGTANDLARTLGIPPDPVAAARIIAEGNLRRVDLGEVNGQLYWNVASVGLSVELARQLTSETKRRWGKLGYALTALRVLRGMRPFRAELIYDGQSVRVRTVQIAVGNGRHFGGGMTVEETAQPDDQLLHVYSIDIDHWWELLALFPAFRSGRHGAWRNVHSFSCREVEIRTRNRKRVNTDGEITTLTPARFKVRPFAVTVYAPVTPR